MRFVNKLRQNIQEALAIYPEVTLYFDRDRGHVYLNGADYQPMAESLKKIFGVQNFAPTYKVEKSVPALKEAVQTIKASGLDVKVIVGGAPVTPEYAAEIGADGFAPDAGSAAVKAKEMVA